MSGIKNQRNRPVRPRKDRHNDDLAKIVDTSDEWITTRTGIQTRHHCTTETHTDMCVGAARQALEKCRHLPGGHRRLCGGHLLLRTTCPPPPPAWSSGDWDCPTTRCALT